MYCCLDPYMIYFYDVFVVQDGDILCAHFINTVKGGFWANILGFHTNFKYIAWTFAS